MRVESHEWDEGSYKEASGGPGPFHLVRMQQSRRCREPGKRSAAQSATMRMP